MLALFIRLDFNSFVTVKEKPKRCCLNLFLHNLKNLAILLEVKVYVDNSLLITPSLCNLKTVLLNDLINVFIIYLN